MKRCFWPRGTTIEKEKYIGDGYHERKKAPDNKREKEKERLIHVTEEQLQAGKAEIMKTSPASTARKSWQTFWTKAGRRETSPPTN